MSVDVVVTDFNMPVMSGLALAEAMTSLRPGMPIVLSSGYVTQELRRDARGAGVSEVIYKEDIFDQLGALLHRLLEQKP